jgi:hypothetical protein
LAKHNAVIKKTIEQTKTLKKKHKAALEKAKAAPAPAPAPASTAPATAAAATALMLAAADKKLQAETRQCGALVYENEQLKRQKKDLQDELTTALAQVASLRASAKRPRDDQGENTEAKRPKTTVAAEAAAEAQAAAAAQVAAAAAATVRADAETAATSTN